MKDRSVEFPNRYRLTKVAGTDDIYDLVPAPGDVTEEGTYINKATLLKDATAALFGLDSKAVPDDVLRVLSKATLLQMVGRSKVSLGGLPEGAVITLNENGSPVEFYVACHNYESGLNGEGRTLLVRKDCYDTRAWHSSNINAYATSSIDTWLNGDYKTLLDEDVQSAIEETAFYYTPGNGDTSVSTLTRSVFLLSVTELGATASYANTEGIALPIASTLQIAYRGGSADSQWTRSPNTAATSGAYCLTVDGNVSGNTCSKTNGSRPAFTLPATYDGGWYIDESGNIYTEQEYESRITDTLGNLVPIPADQIVDGVKIATGSYTGTGTYGKSNPNSLTFDFEPKFIYISENSSYTHIYRGFWCQGMTYMSGYHNQTSYDGTNTAASSGNTFSWYNTNNANNQLNASGKTYYYVAIG